MVSQGLSVFVAMGLIWILRLRNLPSGTPFDEGALSADYNIHVELGFRNYREWKWFGGGK